MHKDALRGEMRARRSTLTAREQEAASRAVCARVLTLDAYLRARSVMAYMACRGELSLAPVMRDALARGKTLLLPRCEAPGVMTARRVGNPDDCARGAYGLPEPGAGCAVFAPEEIDLILAPGVAFDRMGGRLGQGGGYYDRFLRAARAARIGVCHGFALLERVPVQAHDARMDAVITPEGIWRAGERESGHRRK